jgi:hypothetical protein
MTIFIRAAWAARSAVCPGHSATLHSHFLIAAQAVPIQPERQERYALKFRGNIDKKYGL